MDLRDHDLWEEADGDLTVWSVDLATIDRHRCLLFTHKVTLYSFWAIAVRKTDLLRFEELFRRPAIATLKADRVRGERKRAFAFDSRSSISQKRTAAQ